MLGNNEIFGELEVMGDGRRVTSCMVNSSTATVIALSKDHIIKRINNAKSWYI